MYFLNSDPRRILEIGTNHCYFPYFVHCIIPGSVINTVDIDAKALAGVEILKDIGLNITFHNKSSKDFFKDFSEPVDFAWVDGSHTYEDCLEDLINCGKLGASIICIDDFRSMEPVFKACLDFYRQVIDYEVYGQSYIMDHRGILCLIKKSPLIIQGTPIL